MSISEKKSIVEEWLNKNGFFNIHSTENNYFIKAEGEGRASRMFIIIKDDFEIKEQELKEFAIRNNRQAWIAEVKTEEENELRSINWEVL